MRVIPALGSAENGQADFIYQLPKAMRVYWAYSTGLLHHLQFKELQWERYTAGAATGIQRNGGMRLHFPLTEGYEELKNARIKH